jgi:hypothetical protein
MMARYFFNIVEADARDLVRDSDGVVLAGPSAARKEAASLARDILRHGFQGPLETWKIVVTDETGKQILIVPLSEIPAKSIWTWFESRSLVARHRHLFRSGPSARFAAAAGLGIAVQAALLTGLMVMNLMVTDQAVTYQTASAPATSLPTGDAVVAVRFIANATPEVIGEFLDRYKATVIGGPRLGRFYQLRLTGMRPPEEELPKLLSRMTQESIVEFAATVE